MIIKNDQEWGPYQTTIRICYALSQGETPPNYPTIIKQDQIWGSKNKNKNTLVIFLWTDHPDQQHVKIQNTGGPPLIYNSFGP